MKVEQTRITVECSDCDNKRDIEVNLNVAYCCDGCGEIMQPTQVYFEGDKKALLIAILGEAINLLGDNRGESAWKDSIMSLQAGVRKHWTSFQKEAE